MNVSRIVNLFRFGSRQGMYIWLVHPHTHTNNAVPLRDSHIICNADRIPIVHAPLCGALGSANEARGHSNQTLCGSSSSSRCVRCTCLIVMCIFSSARVTPTIPRTRFEKTKPIKRPEIHRSGVLLGRAYFSKF